MTTQDETDVRTADGIPLGREQGFVENCEMRLAKRRKEGCMEGSFTKAREKSTKRIINTKN